MSVAVDVSLVPERIVKRFGWSADSKSVYTFKKNANNAILSIDIITSKVDTLLYLPFDEEDLVSVTPGGDTIVCSAIERKTDIWLVQDFDPDVK